MIDEATNVMKRHYTVMDQLMSKNPAGAIHCICIPLALQMIAFQYMRPFSNGSESMHLSWWHLRPAKYLSPEWYHVTTRSNVSVLYIYDSNVNSRQDLVGNWIIIQSISAKKFPFMLVQVD